jgi:hypothetical protein
MQSSRAGKFRSAWRRGIVLVLALGWAAGFAAGMSWLWRFAYTPGEVISRAPSTRPVEFAAAGDRPLLAVFVHPRCSCSEATLEQVARIRARNGSLDIRIVFVTPAGQPDLWADTALRRQALRIPGAQLLMDRGGRIASRYGAQTSGQTLLYTSDGRLAFEGGITASRGHYGDNDGSDAIAAILLRAEPRHSTTPVFGCALTKGAS